MTKVKIALMMTNRHFISVIIIVPGRVHVKVGLATSDCHRD